MVMFPRESFRNYGPPAKCQMAHGGREVLQNPNCLCPPAIPHGWYEVGYKVLRQRWGRWALKGELAVAQQTGWWVALTTWSQYRPHRFMRPLSLHISATGSGGLQAIHTSGQQAINPGVPATPSQNSGKHYTYKYGSIIKDANQNQPNKGHMGEAWEGPELRTSVTL